MSLIDFEKPLQNPAKRLEIIEILSTQARVYKSPLNLIRQVFFIFLGKIDHFS